VRLRLESEEAAVPTPGGIGGPRGFGGSSDDDGRGGGGDSGEGRSEEEKSDLMSFLSKTGTSLEQVDPKVLSAFEAGRIPAYAVINYLKAYLNPISRVFMRLLPWTMSRILADDLFLYKVALEEGLGIFGKLSAEGEQRRDRFFTEIDFVLCNLLTAFLVDFALVFLPAPSLNLSGGGKDNFISRLNQMLPSNVFEKERFSLAQRFSGYLWTASKLFAVGFACCFFSAVLTNSIIYARSQLDPNFVQTNEMQNPLSVASMYATFLGISSSTRYQLVNGVEIHLFPALFGRMPKLVTEAATLALRLGNTFWGSQQWVMFATLTGVQKAGQ